MEPPNPSEDATTQTRTHKIVVAGENSAGGRIQERKTLKDTPSKTTGDNLSRGNFLTEPVQISEISKETNKQSVTLGNVLFVKIPCDDSIHHLITSRDPKASGTVVSGYNSSSDSVKHSIPTEQSQAHNIQTVIASNNHSTDSGQYLINTGDQRLQNTETSCGTVPGNTPSINRLQHSLTTEDPKSYNTKASDSIAPGDNPSTDYLQHLIATEIPTTTSDFQPGHGSLIVQHVRATEDPNNYTNTSDDNIRTENFSADHPQQVMSTEDPNTLHVKTHDGIPFADNPSTDHLELLIRAESQKTDHIKTRSVYHSGIPSTETGMPLTNVSIKSRPAKYETIPLKDTSSFVGTPLKDTSTFVGTPLKDTSTFVGTPLKDTPTFVGRPLKEGSQTSSSFRTNQHRNVPYFGPVAANECRKLHNKQPATVKEKTHLCQHRRTYPFARPITKKELELALPRKSFFSCHEKALKEAGHEVHTNTADNDITKLDNEKRTPPTERDLSSLQLTQSPNGGLRNNIQIVITDVSVNDILKIDGVELDHVETMNRHDEKATLKVPGVEKMTAKASDPTKLQPYTIKNKRPETAKMEYFEWKPLRKYLEYIKENEQEYLQCEQSSRINAVEQFSSSSLLKLGGAFQLRNHGGKMRPREETLVVASRALRPRTADFDKFSKYRDTEIWTTNPTASMLKQHNKRSPDKNTQAMVTMPTVNTEANPKSELEKLKQKAEEWCKSVSTNIVLKAKLGSLKELGTDDIELTNWSEAFQNCGYIRQAPL